MGVSNISAASQRSRALEALSAARHTTYSLRARGISHPAMRIKELIALGQTITSLRVTAIASNGFSHNGVAMYELAECQQPGHFDQSEAE